MFLKTKAESIFCLFLCKVFGKSVHTQYTFIQNGAKILKTIALFVQKDYTKLVRKEKAKVSFVVKIVKKRFL